MQYIITELECLEQKKVFEFLLDDDRNPLEIYTSVDDGIQVSDIYSGKVEKVLKNTSACFVNIGGETVFLKYRDSDSILYSHKFSKKPGIHENDEVVIQIKNAALKTKNPTATSHISLETKHLLLSYGESGFHVSKSIKQERRESILASLKNTSLSEDYARLLTQVAIIVRSNAIEISDDEVSAELITLLGKFDDFLVKASHTNPFTKLYEARKHYIDRILHAKETIEKVVTDNEEIYNYLLTFKDVLDVEIEYYQDDFTL
jgi:ribonuclease G